MYEAAADMPYLYMSSFVRNLRKNKKINLLLTYDKYCDKVSFVSCE